MKFSKNLLNRNILKFAKFVVCKDIHFHENQMRRHYSVPNVSKEKFLILAHHFEL